METELTFSKFKKSFIVIAALFFLTKVLTPDIANCFLQQPLNQQVQSASCQTVSIWTPSGHCPVDFTGQGGGHSVFDCHSLHNCKFVSDPEVVLLPIPNSERWSLTPDSSFDGPSFDVPIKPPIYSSKI